MSLTTYYFQPPNLSLPVFLITSTPQRRGAGKRTGYSELDPAMGHAGGDRDSSVGIATRYGLDGQGIESRRGRDFPQPSRPPLGPTQPPIQWVPGLSRGVKRPGRGVDHPPSSAEVEGRVQLYIYSPSGSSWPVIG